MDIQVTVDPNSYGIERGVYASWLGNTLQDAIAQGLIDDGFAVSTTEPQPDGIAGKADLAGEQTFSGGQRLSVTTLTYGATVTPDFDDNNLFSLTATGNFTLANPTNAVAGQGGSIFIVQDATGSRIISYGSNWDFEGGTAPALSTAANSVDRLDYLVRTTGSIHARLAKDVK